jgi:Luciferase
MGIGEIIEHELLAWPNVTVRPHRFGGREFRVGRREFGHLHGDSLADLPFSRAIRDELVARGDVVRHHHLPDSGWVSFHLHSAADIPAALDLFWRNYERLRPADG